MTYSFWSELQDFNLNQVMETTYFLFLLLTYASIKIFKLSSHCNLEETAGIEPATLQQQLPMCISTASFPVYSSTYLGNNTDAPVLKLAEDVPTIRVDNLGS